MRSVLIPIFVACLVALLGGATLLWFEHARMAAQPRTEAPAAVVRGQSGNYVAGTLETLDGNGFSVLTARNALMPVKVSATTTIQSVPADGGAPSAIRFNDLSIGDQVIVEGATQDDGSIAATRISVSGKTPLKTP